MVCRHFVEDFFFAAKVYSRGCCVVVLKRVYRVVLLASRYVNIVFLL